MEEKREYIVKVGSGRMQVKVTPKIPICPDSVPKLRPKAVLPHGIAASVPTPADWLSLQLYAGHTKGPTLNLNTHFTLDLQAEKIQELNKKQEPLWWNGGQSPEAQPMKQNLYVSSYQNSETFDRVTELLKEWSRANPALIGKIRHAWVKALTGDAPQNELETTIRTMAETRRDRWNRLAEKIGVPAPDSFHAFRGERNEQNVEDVIRAWKNTDKQLMRVRQAELASWSFNPAVARHFAFAEDPEGKRQNGVFYEANIPFEQTFADLWVDGPGLLIRPAEMEVIAGGPKRDAIMVDKTKVRVVFRGIEYTYADRDKLFAAWKIDHSPSRH